MNRLILVVITTIIMSLSFNSFAEVRELYYESGALQVELNYKNGQARRVS
jgi:antitoxin component YwqK of YwqJK toxin-antitoxin module